MCRDTLMKENQTVSQKDEMIKMEGRAYTVWSYGQQVEHLVPNGRWVLERLRQRGGSRVPVGAEWHELQDLLLDVTGGQPHELYVCDKPFSFVVTVDGKVTTIHARKVVNGELVDFSKEHTSGD